MKVYIYDKKIIPTLGQGPFLEPVEISDQVYRTLRLNGFTVRTVEEVAIEEEMKAKKEKEEISKKVSKETTEEEVPEDDVEETTEDTETTNDDSTTDDTNEVVEYTEEELKAMNISELKEIADSLGLEYKYSIKKADLIALILG